MSDTTPPKIKQPKVRERKLGRHRAVGLHHPSGLIELDPRIKGCLRLDTLIHEFTHHHLDNKLRPLLKHLQKSFGTKKALEIEEALIGDHSTALADFLWKNNVRIIDQP